MNLFPSWFGKLAREFGSVNAGGKSQRTAHSGPVSFTGPKRAEILANQSGVQILLTPVLIGPAIVVVPVRLGVPLMVPSVPPLMIRSPAMLAFRSQVMPTVSRLGTLRTMLGHRIIEPHFGFFDALAAFVSFVCVRARRSDEE
jgi:hypothetical protein